MKRKSEWSALPQIFGVMRRTGLSPAWLAIPICISLCAAVFEGMSIGLLVPLFQGFLQRDFSFALSLPIVGHILAWITQYTSATDKSLFGILVALFVGSVILKSMLRYTADVSMGYVASRSLYHLRKLLFGRYLGFGKLYFDQTTIGYHSTLFAEFASNCIRPLFTIDKYVNALFSLVAYLCVMSFISWQLTLFAIPLFGVMHFSVRFLIMGLRKISSAMAERTAMLNKKTVDILSAIPLVKMYNMEQSEQSDYAHISDRKARLDFRECVLTSLVSPLQELVTMVAALVLFTGTLFIMVRDGSSTPPAFLVYFYLVLNAASKFGTFTGIRGNLASAVGPLEHIQAIFRDEDKFRVPSGKEMFTGFSDTIDFRSLSFSYPGGNPVLQDVSFGVKKGSVTAIVGKTGSGKTTLVSLLLRLYDCPAGSIFIDGTDIRSFDSASLRRHMAVVSQDTFLLNDTMRHNIAYGVPDATDEQIQNAVDAARLTELVERLPNGLSTMLGDRGVRLSGGEKQRVAIARALLKGAQILILDEATSALDSTTERLIQEAVDNAIEGRTAIVIAHRLSTIRNADMIAVLDDGKCVEKGSPEELLKKDGAFARFWHDQEMGMLRQ